METKGAPDDKYQNKSSCIYHTSTSSYSRVFRVLSCSSSPSWTLVMSLFPQAFPRRQDNRELASHTSPSRRSLPHSLTSSRDVLSIAVAYASTSSTSMRIQCHLAPSALHKPQPNLKTLRTLPESYYNRALIYQKWQIPTQCLAGYLWHIFSVSAASLSKTRSRRRSLEI